MPLSKARNRDRMRRIRLHALLKLKPVQPKPIVKVEFDADGQPIPEYI